MQRSRGAVTGRWYCSYHTSLGQQSAICDGVWAAGALRAGWWSVRTGGRASWMEVTASKSNLEHPQHWQARDTSVYTSGRSDRWWRVAAGAADDWRWCCECPLMALRVCRRGGKGGRTRFAVCEDTRVEQRRRWRGRRRWQRTCSCSHLRWPSRRRQCRVQARCSGDANKMC